MEKQQQEGEGSPKTAEARWPPDQPPSFEAWRGRADILCSPKREMDGGKSPDWCGRESLRVVFRPCVWSVFCALFSRTAYLQLNRDHRKFPHRATPLWAAVVVGRCDETCHARVAMEFPERSLAG